MGNAPPGTFVYDPRSSRIMVDPRIFPLPGGPATRAEIEKYQKMYADFTKRTGHMPTFDDDIKHPRCDTAEEAFLENVKKRHPKLRLDMVEMFHVDQRDEKKWKGRRDNRLNAALTRLTARTLTKEGKTQLNPHGRFIFKRKSGFSVPAKKIRQAQKTGGYVAILVAQHWRSPAGQIKSHSVLLMYNPREKQLEFFEPSGKSKRNHPATRFIIDSARLLLPDIDIVDVSGLRRGLQGEQYFVEKKADAYERAFGYCLSWSLLMLRHRMENKHIRGIDLVESLLNQMDAESDDEDGFEKSYLSEGRRLNDFARLNTTYYALGRPGMRESPFLFGRVPRDWKSFEG